MGFMDKAKKLAEQAQQKLDEAQNQFNQGGAPQAPEQGGGVRYDAHGRPIQEEGPPAGTAPPPPAEPAAPPAEPAAPSAPATPDASTPASPSAPAAPASPPAEPAERQPAGQGDADATPDPFKPLQQ